MLARAGNAVANQPIFQQIFPDLMDVKIQPGTLGSCDLGKLALVDPVEGSHAAAARMAGSPAGRPWIRSGGGFDVAPAWVRSPIPFLHAVVPPRLGSVTQCLIAERIGALVTTASVTAPMKGARPRRETVSADFRHGAVAFGFVKRDDPR